LKGIFESVDNQNIIGFIKNAHFYHQLYVVGLLVMATLCNRVGHYIFALWFVSFFFLWPPYEIGQAIVSFFLSVFLSFFIA